MRRFQITTAIVFAFCWITAPVRAANVTVFAAASLSNALQEIGRTYEQAGQGRIIFSFASSSTLAKQIEAGAAADIFISADDDWMNYLSNKKTIKIDARRALLGNRLVVIVPKNSSAVLDVKFGADWLGAFPSGRIATGDPAHVPVGKYAQQAFTKLGVWDQIAPRLARADNVRNALVLVERGEAVAGIVYATDAAVSKGVKVAGYIPEDSHDAITYPMALVGGSTTPEAARFFAYLTTPEAKSMFTAFGFTPR